MAWVPAGLSENFRIPSNCNCNWVSGAVSAEVVAGALASPNKCHWLICWKSVGFSWGWLAVSGAGGASALTNRLSGAGLVRMLAALAIRQAHASNPARAGRRWCGASRKDAKGFKLVNRKVGLWFWVRGC